MRIATTTEALLLLSVQLNGIWLPINQAVRAVRRFCNPAIFHVESDVFDMGVSGSCFFLRYLGKNFGICTLHQVESGKHCFPKESFSLVLSETEGQRVGLSPDETIVVKFENEKYSNLGDLFLARFNDIRGSHNLNKYFLEMELSSTLGDVPKERIKLIFSFGFPTEARGQEIQYDEEEIPLSFYLNPRWMKLFFHIAEPSSHDIPNRRPITLDAQHEFELGDPDGLSGAPVFFVYLDDSNQAHLELAGIITHSNGFRFMLYESDKIRLCLDRHFMQQM